jgi:intracellular multiplication protein IcmG
VASVVTTLAPQVEPKPQEEEKMSMEKQAEPAPPLEIPTKVDQEVSEQMFQLQERSQQLMQELKTQHNATRDRFVSLEEKIEGLDSNMNDLRDAMRSLSSQIEKLEVAERIRAKRQVQEQQVREQKIRAEQQYFVEAVIPGRAWLRAYDGSALTVTVGEIVPGYGKVTSINSYSGVVSTSSGNEIHYGVNS